MVTDSCGWDKIVSWQKAAGQRIGVDSDRKASIQQGFDLLGAGMEAAMVYESATGRGHDVHNIALLVNHLCFGVNLHERSALGIASASITGEAHLPHVHMHLLVACWTRGSVRTVPPKSLHDILPIAHQTQTALFAVLGRPVAVVGGRAARRAAGFLGVH